MAKRKTASKKRTSPAARKTGGKVATGKVKKAAKRRPARKAVKRVAKKTKRTARKSTRKTAKKTVRKKAVKRAARKVARKKTVRKAARKTARRKVTRKKAARKLTRKVAKRKVKKAAKKKVRKVVKKTARKPAAKRAPRPRLAKPTVVRAAGTEEPVSGLAPVVDVQSTRPRTAPPVAPPGAEERGPTLYEPDEPRELPSSDDEEHYAQERSTARTLFETGAAPAPAPGAERDALVGRPAPDFALPDARGQMHTLASYRGRKVVLYFYPKDDTPGCTREACGFRDRLTAFEERNAAVLGISPDPVESHATFAQQYGLNFPILSDEGHAVAERYGVWVLSPSPAGEPRHKMQRTTFIIDESGVIAHVFRDVQPDGHEEEVLRWFDRERTTDAWR